MSKITPVKVIIDTNVLYAGLYSSNGASHLILRAVEKKQIKPILSISLLFEYEDVMKRKKTILNLSPSEMDSLLDHLCRLSEHHRVYFLWRPFLSDPKDDHILELAVSSGTEKIVTHNTKDFKGAASFGIQAVTPQQLLEDIA